MADIGQPQNCTGRFIEALLNAEVRGNDSVSVVFELVDFSLKWRFFGRPKLTFAYRLVHNKTGIDVTIPVEFVTAGIGGKLIVDLRNLIRRPFYFHPGRPLMVRDVLIVS